MICKNCNTPIHRRNNGPVWVHANGFHYCGFDMDDPRYADPRDE